MDPEEAEATEKNGLLTIRLPKIDKKKVAKLKVKSSKPKNTSLGVFFGYVLYS